MFSTQVLNDFSVKQCSMFIDDVLISADSKPAREILLHELIVFKKKHDENEEALSFDFQTGTGLYLDIILEIGKYLTLNGALNAF
ncbi:unnamed protein product [Rotaria sordida]|uniref:Reverse transcriptase n=1 Tax=Rotaria sordida TaxID=392033 RepID=A0A815T503_9BILA|nr:unnamed protein product [Rotaria sordida]CAF1498413.1 unnamed protein product [Rotaria sordida]